MADRYFGRYEAPSLNSFTSFSSSSDTDESASIRSAIITCDMVNNPRCELQSPPSSIYSTQAIPTWTALTPPVSEAGEVDEILSEVSIMHYDREDKETPESAYQMMILFAGGDVNSAVYFVCQSLNNPFARNAIATVYVEKCIYDEFMARVAKRMNPLPLEVVMHPTYILTQRHLDRFNIPVVRAQTRRVPSARLSPCLVPNCQHSMFGKGVSGVICVRSFSTNEEILKLSNADSMLYASINIWNEDIRLLYQLVSAMNCKSFSFNCCNVDIQPIAASFKAGNSDVHVENGFYYEVLLINEQPKAVVFPISAHIGNKSKETPPARVDPISYLNE